MTEGKIRPRCQSWFLPICRLEGAISTSGYNVFSRACALMCMTCMSKQVETSMSKRISSRPLAMSGTEVKLARTDYTYYLYPQCWYSSCPSIIPIPLI